MEFPNSYNYPCHLQHWTGEEWKVPRVDDLNAIYYHHVFEKTPLENPFEGIIGRDRKSKTFLEMTRKVGLYSPPCPGFLGRLKLLIR